MEKPPTRALPLLGEKMPVIMESRVVLPAPLGPSSPKIVLSSTTRLKLLTASFPFLYLLLSPLHMRGQSPTFPMPPIWMHSSSMVESLSWREVSFCSTSFSCCVNLSMTKQRGKRTDWRTPNSWGTTQWRYMPRRAKTTNETQSTVMQVCISGVRLERELGHWSIEHWLKMRQKRRLNEKVGQRAKPRGSSRGYWKRAMLRVAPMRLVQIATRQPIILAAALPLRKTWKNMAMPIWARIQPRKTTTTTEPATCLKKEFSRKRIPKPQNTRLVRRLMAKLQRKLMAQQLVIFMPFMRIIWMSRSSFQSTIKQRKTGSSRLSERGKMIVATVFISISTKIPPCSLKGMYVYPETILLPDTNCTQAELTMSITERNPSAIVKQWLQWSSSALFIRISVTPLGRQNRNSLTSLILRVASSLSSLALQKQIAASGSFSAEVVFRSEQKVSVLRNSYLAKRSSEIEPFDRWKSGEYLYSQLLWMELLKVVLQGQVFGMSPSSPCPVGGTEPSWVPMNSGFTRLWQSQMQDCALSRQTQSQSWSMKVQSLNLLATRGQEPQIVSFWLGMFAMATLRITMVSSRQIIGVNIWQQLVHGCRFCRCRFFKISAFIWCPCFSLICQNLYHHQVRCREGRESMCL